jgi:Rad3-related DNA helicase
LHGELFRVLCDRAQLIRSGDDSGRVVILDPRIVTKYDGRAFMGALPDGVEPELV